MKKPLIITLICLLLVCSMVVLALIWNNQTTDVQKETSAALETTVGPDDETYVNYDPESQDAKEQLYAKYSEIAAYLQEQLSAGWTYTPESVNLSPAFADTEKEFSYAVIDLDKDGIYELLLGYSEDGSFKIVQFIAADENGMPESLFTGSEESYLILLEDNTLAEYGAVNISVYEENETAEESEDAGGYVWEKSIEALRALKYTDGTLTEAELPETLNEAQPELFGLNS